MTVRLAFTHAQGDLDLRVFNAAQSQLAISESTGDAEQVTVAVTAGQKYYFRVYGYSGAVSPSYSMTVDVPNAPAPAPEIDVRGNSVSIADGDASPSTTDGTNFGSQSVPSGSVSRTFTIANTGAAALNLTSAPLVQISGAQASDFTVTAQPASAVAAGGSTTFTISFDPSASGQRTATVTILNNDANEGTYDFVIRGTGTAPPPGDQFENNDTFAAARSLAAVDQTYTALSIDAANDDDYYSIVPLVSGSMTVRLAFTHAQGDVDLRAFNAARNQLAISESTGNSEQVTSTVTAGQTYYIRVYGYSGATNPNYSMTIDVPGSAAARAAVTSLATTDGGALVGRERAFRPLSYYFLRS
jgi:hypothetical protein